MEPLKIRELWRELLTEEKGWRHTVWPHRVRALIIAWAHAEARARKEAWWRGFFQAYTHETWMRSNGDRRRWRDEQWIAEVYRELGITEEP